MERLGIREGDVRRLRAVLEASHHPDGNGVPAPMLQALRELLGCDSVGFDERDIHAAVQHLMQEVTRGGTPAAWAGVGSGREESLFWTELWSSVLCCHGNGDLSGPDEDPDLVSEQRAERRSYLDCLGPDLAHELMLFLHHGPDRTLRLRCANGRGTNFGERERFLLQLLRPHLTEAHRLMLRRQAQAHLTTRQLEVLELVRAGLSNRQIARRLRVSEGTVRTHLNNAFTRLHVCSRGEAAALTGQ